MMASSVRDRRPPILLSEQAYEEDTEVECKGKIGKIVKVHAKPEHHNTAYRYTYEIEFRGGSTCTLDHNQVRQDINPNQSRMNRRKHGTEILPKSSKKRKKPASQARHPKTPKRKKATEKIIRLKNMKQRPEHVQGSGEKENLREFNAALPNDSTELWSTSDDEDGLIDGNQNESTISMVDQLDTSSDKEDGQQLQRTKDNLPAKVANLQDQVKDLEAKNATMSDKLEEYHRELQDAADAREELEEYKGKNEELISELAQEKNLHKITRETIWSIERERDNLRKELKKTADACGREQAKAAIYLKEKRKAKSDYEAKLKLAEQMAQILRERLEEAESELRERKNDLGQNLMTAAPEDETAEADCSVDALNSCLLKIQAMNKQLDMVSKSTPWQESARGDTEEKDRTAEADCSVDALNSCLLKIQAMNKQLDMVSKSTPWQESARGDTEEKDDANLDKKLTEEKMD